MSCAHCLAVQACCMYGVTRAILSWAKNHVCCCCQSRVHPELYSPRVKEVAPPRTRAQVGQRRQAVARQMKTCKESATVLFQKHDENNSGYLESEQLRKLMIELNGNIAVSDHALNFVMSQATIGVDDNRISPAELAPAVSLWRYLQHEQAFIEQRFDEFDSSNNQQLEIEELKEFLTSLNDGIPVTDKEARWVFSQTDKDKSSGLDKTELRAAVALWYPTVYNRRKVQLAHVVCSLSTCTRSGFISSVKSPLTPVFLCCKIDDLLRGKMAGRKRKAMAAQVWLKKQEAGELFSAKFSRLAHTKCMSG